ncbi:MAG: hypothetical protein WCI04_03155 [archaeon]
MVAARHPEHTTTIVRTSGKTSVSFHKVNPTIWNKLFPKKGKKPPGGVTTGKKKY